MVVLGLLETSVARIFHDVLVRTATVLLPSTETAFASILLRESVDVAIIDPGAGVDHTIPDAAHPAASALAKVPHVPFVLYITGPTRSFTHTHSLLQLKPAGLLSRGDSTPAAILAAVREAAGLSLSRRVLAQITPRLESLPWRMRGVLWRILQDTDVSEKVDDLCESSSMTRRSFDRQLLKTGLASAQTFLECGRLLKAYARLQTSGSRCDDVVREMEYSSSRRLQNDSHSVLGMPPTAMRRLTANEFAARLGQALVRTNGSNGHDHVRSSVDVLSVHERPEG
jgi:AraC-like DNA-binding protein